MSNTSTKTSTGPQAGDPLQGDISDEDRITLLLLAELYGEPSYLGSHPGKEKRMEELDALYRRWKTARPGVYAVIQECLALPNPELAQEIQAWAWAQWGQGQLDLEFREACLDLAATSGLLAWPSTHPTRKRELDRLRLGEFRRSAAKVLPYL